MTRLWDELLCSPSLEQIAELEARYDGPIPPQHFRTLYGEKIGLLANAEFLKRLALEQIEIIRIRRRNGTFYPAMVSDLQLYIARWRETRRELREVALALEREVIRRNNAAGEYHAPRATEMLRRPQ